VASRRIVSRLCALSVTLLLRRLCFCRCAPRVTSICFSSASLRRRGCRRRRPANLALNQYHLGPSALPTDQYPLLCRPSHPFRQYCQPMPPRTSPSWTRVRDLQLKAPSAHIAVLYLLAIDAVVLWHGILARCCCWC
jgi:hypothetical protein